MALLDRIAQYCQKNHLFTEGSTVIVGLSGGPDSVALLSLLKKLQPRYGLTLIAAHLDHQWRPDSDKDTALCKALCETLDVPFLQAQAKDINLSKKPRSQEEHGRLLRRTFFEQLVKEYKADAIALGHHRDDQQETFFLRMIRGASIAGLAAMKPKNGLYIRPLLDCTKQELLECLALEKLEYVTDSTNEDPRYLRNAIRHKVIPAFRDCDDRFDGSFLKTLNMVQETDAFLERLTKEVFKGVATHQDGTLYLTIKKFLAADTYLQHRILVHWLCREGVPFTPSTSFFNEIIRFMGNNANEHQMHSSWSLVKDSSRLRINHLKKQVLQ